MFRHGDIHLLPQALWIVQHRDRTRHGNSAFAFHFVFRIGSCNFSFGAHINSWSGTRDTTLIRGLNHGWNRTIVKTLLHAIQTITLTVMVENKQHIWIRILMHMARQCAFVCGMPVVAIVLAWLGPPLTNCWGFWLLFCCRWCHWDKKDGCSPMQCSNGHCFESGGNSIDVDNPQLWRDTVVILAADGSNLTHLCWLLANNSNRMV